MAKSYHHEPPFYGEEIIRKQQEDYIRKLLEKYQKEPVTDDLKKKVWDELQMEKHLGRVIMPFKLGVRRDPTGKYPEYIEVVLDTKV